LISSPWGRGLAPLSFSSGSSPSLFPFSKEGGCQQDCARGWVFPFFPSLMGRQNWPSRPLRSAAKTFLFLIFHAFPFPFFFFHFSLPWVGSWSFGTPPSPPLCQDKRTKHQVLPPLPSHLPVPSVLLFLLCSMARAFPLFSPGKPSPFPFFRIHPAPTKPDPFPPPSLAMLFYFFLYLVSIYTPFSGDFPSPPLREILNFFLRVDLMQ